MVYDHPAMESAVAETLGVIVFQEQVLRVAMAVAGFSPAEADGLRRAMSRSRSEAAMAALRERFLSGAGTRGVHPETSLSIWQQLEGFAGFGFCKSHAAAFALVAYQTLYLKAHFPAEYYCALLNHQPLGFYPPEVLVGDARRHGVLVVHPDVNCSDVNCTLEQAEEQQAGQPNGPSALGYATCTAWARSGRSVSSPAGWSQATAPSPIWPIFADAHACPGRPSKI